MGRCVMLKMGQVAFGRTRACLAGSLLDSFLWIRGPQIPAWSCTGIDHECTFKALRDSSLKNHDKTM